MQISFEQLPTAVAELTRKVEHLTSLVTSRAPVHPSSNDEDDIVTVQQAAKLVKLAVPTVYALVGRNEIPFMKREGSKRLYFSKRDLEDWIRRGRRKTKEELAEEVVQDLKLFSR